jgi:hypothetical protein
LKLIGKPHPLDQNNKGGFSLQYLNPLYTLKAMADGNNGVDPHAAHKEARYGKTGHCRDR